MSKSDRRVKRTRRLLREAFIRLIHERGYDAVTVQEIVDRASVGRATFYLHYGSKEDLLISCHEEVVDRFGICPPSPEELLAAEPPAAMVEAYRHLEEARALLAPLLQGYAKDSAAILRRMRESSARKIEVGLRSAFPDSESSVPLELVANFLAGAQLGLLQWWLEKRRDSGPDDLARAFHRLRRAVILAAFQRPGPQMNE